MENASKALIIAGAILLAILIISLGIMILSQAQDTITNSGMSKAEITTFNSNFTKFEGKQKGSVVKEMIQEVIASNADERNKENNITISIKFGDKTYEGDKIVSSIVSNTKSYTISCDYSNGRVNKITIE